MAIEFNTDFYLQSKFNQLEAAGRLEEFGLTDVESLEAFFAENGIDAQEHYLNAGMAEGINPSAEFDTNAYLEAKLEQLQGEQFEGQYADWTTADLAEFFQERGLTALDHYNRSGINEGIEPQVPEEAEPEIPEFTLQDALVAEELPEEYALSDAAVDFGNVSVDVYGDIQAIAQAVVDAAANADELTLDASYSLTDTLANIRGADADVREGADAYTVEDSAANLVDASSAQAIITLGNADTINVAGDATVAQMDTLVNEREYSNIGSFSLSDSVENLLAGGDIVANAEAASVAGEPVLTVEGYNEIAEIATVETFTVEDTAANILEAGADADALANAGSVAVTDEEVTLEQALELDALELGIDYSVAPFSLEDAVAAEQLPNNYELTADVFAAGEVDVETATDTFATVSSIVEGAQNSEDLNVADLFTWSLADTLANLEAADAAVVEGAEQYSLTNEDADLGELSSEQYQLVEGAENTEDYTFTVVPSPISEIAAQGPVVEGNDIEFSVEMDYAVNVERTIDYQINGETTATAGEASPLDDLGQITGTVTIAAGETTGTFTLSPVQDGMTEGREAFSVSLLSEDGTEVVTTSNTVVIEDPANAGQNVTLTTGVDELEGGAGNDTFTGVYTGDNATNTITTLDSIDGAGGRDVFRINDTSDAFNFNNDVSNVGIDNVEEVRVRSANDFTLNSTNIAGVEMLNVQQAGNVDLTAADTTAINVEGVEGNGTKEVFTLDLNDALSVADGSDDTTIAFNGTTVDLADADEDPEVAAKLAAATYTDWTAADNGDGTVTFTAKEVGDQTNVTAGDFTFTEGTEADTSFSGTVTTDTQGSSAVGGEIDLDGGSTQDVVADNQVNVTADNAAGAVNVTHDNQGAGDIAITDGTDVTVTASSEVATGDITVGTAGNEASGAVDVTQNLTSEGDVLDNSGSAINVTGGTTVDVTVNGTITADEHDDDGNDLTAPDVNVNGDGNTTDVTVTQNLTANDFDKEVQTPAKTETATVTFGALEEGEAVFISEAGATAGNDLAFTAAKDLSAEEVAAAFANLSAEDTQTPTGPVANGYFTGNLDAGWTSGEANGDSVTFTSTTTGNKTDLQVATDDDGTAVGDNATNGADFDIDVTDGADEVVAEDEANVSTSAGAVTVDDSNGPAITNITLNGYGAGSDIIEADALETLTLSNSSADLTVDAAVEELTVNLEGITGGADLDLDDANSTLTTVNVVTSGTDSAANIVAASATALNVSGDAKLTTTDADSDLSKLQNVTVAGAAGLVLTGTDAAVLETIDASGTTGDVTATIDTGIAAAANEATAYAGGSGVDNVTLTDDTTVEAGVSLGASNDKLTLTAATTAITGDVDGGEGDADVISMDTTSAGNLDGDALNATGFEQLELTGAADGETVDVATLGFGYVSVNGVTDSDGVDDVFTIDSIDSGSTVAVTADVGDGVADNADADKIVINVTDADTNAGDSINLVLDNDSGVDADTVEVDDVETVNISSMNDVSNQMILAADSAETITVDGNAATALTLDDSSDQVTLIDASTMTGALTVTANGATAGTTVNGGSGADNLTADGNGDVLNGGDGNDTLTGANLTQLSGGDGADTFVMNTPSNVNSYSTITDLETSDVIDLDTTDAADKGFISSAVTLGGTAVFQDLANATIAEIDGNGDADAAWFQFDGNTYIVESDGDTSDTTDFENGADSIIQINGEFDLSMASYNQTDGTIEIA